MTRWGSLIKFDTLTEVYTRAHFLAEMQRACSNGGVFLMANADHFKKINDTYGHIVSDEALKAIASALTASVGDMGLVGRLGGEEFGIFLPKAMTETAARAAEKIRQFVAAKGQEIDLFPLQLTVSIGAATCIADRSLSDTIKLADHLLYTAKHAGRNCAFIEGISVEDEKRLAPLRV